MQPFNALLSLDGCQPEPTIPFGEQKCASSSPMPSDLYEPRFVRQDIHTSIWWHYVRWLVTALSFVPWVPKSVQLDRHRSLGTSVVPSSYLRHLWSRRWTNTLPAKPTAILLMNSYLSLGICIKTERPLWFSSGYSSLTQRMADLEWLADIRPS